MDQVPIQVTFWSGEKDRRGSLEELTGIGEWYRSGFGKD